MAEHFKYEEMTDEELIDQLREGDRQVMDYICDKYKNLVRSKAKSMYILGGDSEDLIQEGMIGLFKAVRDYDCGRDASFYTFADLCISRQMYTAVQASKRLKHSPLNSYVSLYERSSEGTDNEEKNLIEALAARTQMSPEELFLDKERVEDLERAIETELSSFEKQVLDLYRLIVHSKLPSAEQFEQWVFDEVLPTIRKHGAYLTREKLWEVATSPEALMKLCSDLLAEREANISLRKENAQLEGKAAFYDLFIDLKHSTNLRTTAKELDVPERRFVRFLIERRFVYRTASGNVLPYANVKNTGLFCVKDYCNHGHTGSYTLVTPKGKLYFAQLREMILLVS